MLVLLTKSGDSIKIDDDIAVTVVQIKDDKVRLGISTSKTVPVVHEQGTHKGIKCDEATVTALLRELDDTKEQLEKYKAALFAYAQDEWSATTQSDIDKALNEPFDFQAELKTLEAGNAA
jgi:carbon storage regulator CsrA